MTLRTLLYADDATIFINLKREGLLTVKNILDMFGKAPGLVANFDKSSIHPIRCEELDL